MSNPIFLFENNSNNSYQLAKALSLKKILHFPKNIKPCLSVWPLQRGKPHIALCTTPPLPNYRLIDMAPVPAISTLIDRIRLIKGARSRTTAGARLLHTANGGGTANAKSNHLTAEVYLMWLEIKKRAKRGQHPFGGAAGDSGAAGQSLCNY